MLKELADYAVEHQLAATAGFKPKKITAYILLSKNGEFIDIDTVEKGRQSVYAPDIGSAANGTRYCNPLIEKAKIPLMIIEDEKKDANIPTKHGFFISMLEDGGKHEPSFNAVLYALCDDSEREKITAEYLRRKLKPGDPIGFSVDGVPIETSTAYHKWWGEFRRQFSQPASDEMFRCLITGELTEPLATVNKVSGLSIVGGHSSGDAFLCFDKDAYRSYGLQQSSNAAVSEEGMTAVNAASTELIKKAPVLCGAKQVHWYSSSVPDIADVYSLSLEGVREYDDELEEEAEDDEQEDRAQNERDALGEAKKLFDSINNGELPSSVPARYYIMPLSGASGRMMVRGWYEGKYEDLYRNTMLWFDDLRLISSNGKSTTKPPKLRSLYIRLLKPGGDSKKVFERMDKELSSLSVRIVDAIINGNPLPDEVPARVLRWLRSEMLGESGGDGKSAKRQTDSESMAFQFLKAWLIRKQRNRGDKELIGENIDTSKKSSAYLCGRLMAVYGAIHKAAMPEVNVSVTERYYTSASTTPSFVIGKLAQLSVHHLATLDQKNPGLATVYRRWLDLISSGIDPADIPKTFDLEQQTEFALGYYSQRAELYKPNKNNKDRTEEE